MIDSRDFDLEGFDRSVPMEERRERLASILDSRPAEQALTLDGVVYTTVANPFDGRKRAWDLLTHFVWAMRDRPDATLLLKTSHPNMLFTLACLLGEFVKLHPFACRIVIVHGFVPNETYAAMIEATDYVVNCSAAEGQCLPLMEFMSCGKPAIAPRNSALRDYIDDDNSFLVSCHPEPTIWPHDERQMLRATRGRIDMMSLARAFQDSFVVARMETGRYRAMSEAATESLRRHCSDAVTLERLGRALRRWSEETLDRRMAASAD
jgi:glycosyltransferase involved in cell wall biosynthesis